MSSFEHGSTLIPYSVPLVYHRTRSVAGPATCITPEEEHETKCTYDLHPTTTVRCGIAVWYIALLQIVRGALDVHCARRCISPLGVNANSTRILRICIIAVYVCIHTWRAALRPARSAGVSGAACGMRIMRCICSCGWCYSTCACCGVQCMCRGHMG